MKGGNRSRCSLPFEGNRCFNEAALHEGRKFADMTRKDLIEGIASMRPPFMKGGNR